MLNLRVWEFFFADLCGGIATGQRLVPSPGERVVLSPLPHTRHPRRDVQSQARQGRRTRSFSAACGRPRLPRAPLS